MDYIVLDMDMGPDKDMAQGKDSLHNPVTPTHQALSHLVSRQ